MEYAIYTGDISLISKYRQKLESILDEFLSNSENGLIKKFEGKEKWNFYDWSEHLEGALYGNEKSVSDLIINCLFVLALDSYMSMCEMAEIPFKYGELAEEMRVSIRKEFLCENGFFTFHNGKEQYTVLGNALAVLCGAAFEKEAAAICDSIVDGNLTPSSLSMNIWKYEAMMFTDVERYREYILDEIRKNYKKMLDSGSKTVWETLEGSEAFGNAGSLCHGWSAVPVYIYNKLGIIKQ